MEKDRHVRVASPPERRDTREEIGGVVNSPPASDASSGSQTATGTVASTTDVAAQESAVSEDTVGPLSQQHPSQAATSSPGRNGQLPQQGTLTITRRSSARSRLNTSSGSFESHSDSPEAYPPRGQSVNLDELLDNVDLTTDSLPAVDTPDACDKAALRLRCLLRKLQHGEISADLLQRNLHYAARVLEAVFLDETKVTSSRGSRRATGLTSAPSTTSPPPGGFDADGTQSQAVTQKRKLRTPVWARLRLTFSNIPDYYF